MEYISRNDIENLENAAMARDINVTVQERYSGRAMFGQYCLGLTVPSVFDAFRIATLLGEMMSEYILVHMSDNAATDDMGLGTIIYFPGLQVRDVPEEVDPATS